MAANVMGVTLSDVVAVTRSVVVGFGTSAVVGVGGTLISSTPAKLKWNPLTLTAMEPLALAIAPLTASAARMAVTLETCFFSTNVTSTALS